MVFLSLVIFLVGCGGSGSNKSATAEDIIDLSGKWIISYDDLTSNATTTGCGTINSIYINTITIAQNGTQLKVTIDDNTNPINGSISGNNISATGTVQMENGSTPKFNFNLNISSNSSLNGEFYWSQNEGSLFCYGEDWISASRSSEETQ
jgi:hypothetical protein